MINPFTQQVLNHGDHDQSTHGKAARQAAAHKAVRQAAPHSVKKRRKHKKLAEIEVARAMDILKKRKELEVPHSFYLSPEKNIPGSLARSLPKPRRSPSKYGNVTGPFTSGQVPKSTPLYQWSNNLAEDIEYLEDQPLEIQKNHKSLVDSLRKAADHFNRWEHRD